MKNPINRRTFLRVGAMTGLASGIPINALADNDMAKAAKDEGVKRYVTLGRTGLKISDISFGSSRLRNGQEHLVRHALDRGVNYYDTAESYTRGVSEVVMGNALKGDRDRVHIATKSHVGPDDSADQIMERLETSLGKLQTDYVDIFFNHAVNDVERLKNGAWFEFVEKAKRQGKIRFSGFSGHAGRLTDCIDYAVLPDSLARAKAKNVGIVAMKVLRGAKLNDMRAYEAAGATYAQAAFKWVLKNPSVDAAIISMTSTDDIDEYLGGSGGQAVSETDMQLLHQYAQMTDMTYCRHVCNDCEGACPYNVSIPDVLRTRMYATDYGDFSFAKAEYQQLEHNASPCLSCDGAPCRDACTHNIKIADLCGPTHQLLS
jgi:predicted aldo/keto reductase-like oxidoreductase